MSMGNLGYLYYDLGELAAARPYLEEALAFFRLTGILFFPTLRGLGGIALLQGDARQALAYYEELLEGERRQGNKGHIARAIHYLGLTALYMGDYVQAAGRFHEALALVQDTMNTHDMGTCLVGVAGVQRSAQRGALLLGAARAELDVHVWQVEPLHQGEIERIEAAARAALGEVAFAAAYAEGAALPLDQVIAETLADSQTWATGAITAADWGNEES